VATFWANASIGNNQNAIASPICAIANAKPNDRLPESLEVESMGFFLINES
jgi:hypothetical protein